MICSSEVKLTEVLFTTSSFTIGLWTFIELTLNPGPHPRWHCCFQPHVEGSSHGTSAHTTSGNISSDPRGQSRLSKMMEWQGWAEIQHFAWDLSPMLFHCPGCAPLFHLFFIISDRSQWHLTQSLHKIDVHFQVFQSMVLKSERSVEAMFFCVWWVDGWADKESWLLF